MTIPNLYIDAIGKVLNTEEYNDAIWKGINQQVFFV